MNLSPHFSANLNVQLLAASLEAMGVEHIVFSPGSRNGALMMHFNALNSFKTYVLVDERSAAYTALGMAQKLKKPVVICCTSGSAAANYYPAVTEAFYQNIPLIVLTTDRPRKFIDQFNGQTIRQENLFEKHTYHNENLLEGDDDETLTGNFLSLKKSVTKCIEKSGPVHINFPLAEPLYEKVSDLKIHFEKLTLPRTKKPEIRFKDFEKIVTESQKIMFLVGMHDFDAEFNRLVEEISALPNVIFLTENTSNLHAKAIISQIDNALFTMPRERKKDFTPDLLITLGQNIISKKIKNFLRENPPKTHWHVDPYWHPDTFYVLSKKIQAKSVEFLQGFKNLKPEEKSNYRSIWLNLKEEKNNRQAAFLENTSFSDLKVFEKIIQNLPQNIQLHYSNSSVIRYAQLFEHEASIQVFCNRGTSGIDGSTSTAIGHAMLSKRPTTLVTGDLSFFYDSNALWNKYIPSDFRIILINNGGGDIFKIIPGPSETGVLNEFFFTPHQLNPLHLANLYHFKYLEANDLDELQQQLNSLWQGNKPKILAVNTYNQDNSGILKEFMKA